MTDPIGSLLRQAKTLLDGVPQVAPFLDDWPELGVRRAVAPTLLPVLSVLDRLPGGASPSTAGLVEAIVTAAPSLAWGQTYKAEDFGPAFLERYGWSEFIGLRGPVPSTRIACGVLLLGPDIVYPAHSHAAEEVYVPLSGTARWQRGEEPWRPAAPASAIHHPPWLAHAMATGSEPLLALYVWRGGDLAARSIIAPARPAPGRA